MHFDPFYNAKELGAVSDLTAEQAKTKAIGIAFAKIAGTFEALREATNP